MDLSPDEIANLLAGETSVITQIHDAQAIMLNVVGLVHPQPILVLQLMHHDLSWVQAFPVAEPARQALHAAVTALMEEPP